MFILFVIKIWAKMELFLEGRVSNCVICVLRPLENILKVICPSAKKNKINLYSFKKLCVIKEKTS